MTLAAVAVLLMSGVGHVPSVHGTGPIERVSLTSTSGQAAGGSFSPRVSGDDLPLTTLSQGTHTVTLTATDSDGNQASDGITIQIVATPLSETPPTPTPTLTPTPTPTSTPAPAPAAVPGISAPGLGALVGTLLALAAWSVWRRRRQTSVPPPQRPV